MDAPPLPREPADLDQWAVYADVLEERGDRAADAIRADLAMPSRPSADDLAAFRLTCGRHAREYENHAVEWALGHARTLRLVSRADAWARRRLGRSERHALAADDLAQAAQLLAEPRFQRLESLDVRIDRGSFSKFWRRFCARLPATCTRLRMSTRGLSEDDYAAIADNLPSQVVVVGVNSHVPQFLSLLAPRLRSLELNYELPVSKAHEVEQALDAKNAVVLRGGVVVEGNQVTPPHWQRGLPGDALFLHSGEGHFAVVRRESVFSLQRRFGLVGVRAQLERTLPEGFDVTLHEKRVDFMEAGGVLLRHPDGRWSVRPTRMRSGVLIEVEGVASDAPPVTLRSGDVLRVNGEPWIFHTEVRGA
ncbi:MAG: hypothetical protein Q8S33_13940 [Myxococcales bacterium]|nr:hypothetical protein [Myxococcales bacterium]